MKGKCTPADEVFAHIQQAADALLNEVGAVLKPAGLTPTQYNVLRILRAAHPDPVTCGQLAERMITKDPDITRLTDRMEARGLIVRERDTRDRRHVTIGITEPGLKVLKDLDEPINNLHKRQFGKLSAQDLKSLVSLLEMVRNET